MKRGEEHIAVSEEKDILLKERLDALIKTWGYEGVVRVTRNGAAVCESVTGYADHENRVRNKPGTRFYVASVSKQFTACCVMMLQERNRLDIDDTLDKYLPEYMLADQVTLRQMLNMASGIPDNINEVLNFKIAEIRERENPPPGEFFRRIHRESAEPITLESALHAVNDKPFKFAPGTQFSYSNTNYVFLGVIVERVSGLSLEDFMMQNIFLPLGMRSSVVGGEFSDAASCGFLDGTYYPLGKCADHEGDGCVVTTAKDLSIWQNAILDGKLLSRKGWRQVFSMYLGQYGFGWMRQGNFFAHTGGLLGYRALSAIDFDRRLTVAALSAREPAPETIGDNFHQDLLRIAADTYIEPVSPKLTAVNGRNLPAVLRLKAAKDRQLHVEPCSVRLARASCDRTLKPYLLTEGNQEVGFALLRIDKKANAFAIESFMVDELVQDRGYETILVGLCADALKKAGARRITVPYDFFDEPVNRACMEAGFRLVWEGYEQVYEMTC